METPSILYRDAQLAAVHKPAGLLVHRSAIAAADDYLLQRVRGLLGRRVYAVHRLDRPTSGVLLFALTPDAARDLSWQFERQLVRKRYLAVVRGWPEAEGRIDYPLDDGGGRAPRSAITDYRRLACTELPVAVGRYPSSRYALLQLNPRTGRFHQIRRHLHHIHHPVIGDTTHGEGRHNRLFRDRFGIRRLLLHAWSVGFEHPLDGRPVTITAPLGQDWLLLLRALDWGDAVRH
jgi:tRNA pseudouridine65 synthase